MDKLTFPEALKRAKERGGRIVTHRDGIYHTITLEEPKSNAYPDEYQWHQTPIAGVGVPEAVANLKSLGWDKEEDRLGLRRDIPPMLVWTPPKEDIPLGFRSWEDLDDYIATQHQVRAGYSMF